MCEMVRKFGVKTEIRTAHLQVYSKKTSLSRVWKEQKGKNHHIFWGVE